MRCRIATIPTPFDTLPRHPIDSANSLPPPPSSGDRTSLSQSSPRKREFLRFGLETCSRFSLRLPFLGDWRLGTNAQKAYKMRQFRRVRAYSFWLRECWLGREDSNRDMASWIRMLSPVREESQNPFFVEVHRPFETLEFRAPYRIRGVQSFGDKWAFRTITSAPCREGVPSSNEKSVPLLGLIAAQTRAENMRRRRSKRDSNSRCDLPLPKRARSQLSHYIAANPAGFTLRLSSCRFHDASTNDISD
jgi:hypothetical protein